MKHPGNSVKDTAGCISPGKNRDYVEAFLVPGGPNLSISISPGKNRDYVEALCHCWRIPFINVYLPVRTGTTLKQPHNQKRDSKDRVYLPVITGTTLKHMQKLRKARNYHVCLPVRTGTTLKVERLGKLWAHCGSAPLWTKNFHK